MKKELNKFETMEILKAVLSNQGSINGLVTDEVFFSINARFYSLKYQIIDFNVVEFKLNIDIFDIQRNRKEDVFYISWDFISEIFVSEHLSNAIKRIKKA